MQENVNTIEHKKCEFLKKEVIFLGHMMTEQRIKPNPEKVRVIKELPSPKTKKQLQTMIGMISYYRKFVKNCAEIMEPLFKLLRKGVKFVWSENCEIAFRKLIEILIKEPILGFPDFEETFHLQVDASEASLGFVLSQFKQGNETAIAYGSYKMNKHEIKYPIYQKEALAVIKGVKHFHHYLYGRKFVIWTDNTSITWLYANNRPHGRLARWIMTLLEYSFDIKYRRGAENGNADALSRLQQVAAIEEPTESIFTRISKEQVKDKKLKEIMDKVENGEEEGFGLDIDNVLWKITKKEDSTEEEYQMVVPELLKQKVLKACHDSFWSGHGGAKATAERLKKKYYWRGMSTDIERYCRGCEICSFRKDNHHIRAPLQPTEVNKAFHTIYMDLIGPLPISNGFKHIIIFVCALTKWIEAKPVISTDAEEAAKILFEEIIIRHGCCERLITDRGSGFTSILC